MAKQAAQRGMAGSLQLCMHRLVVEAAAVVVQAVAR